MGGEVEVEHLVKDQKEPSSGMVSPCSLSAHPAKYLQDITGTRPQAPDDGDGVLHVAPAGGQGLPVIQGLQPGVVGCGVVVC